MPDERLRHRELPVFATERLILRPRSLADYPACLAMDRDPEVVRYVPGPWSDAEAHRAFLHDRITRAYPDGLGYWCIFPKQAPRRFVGWVLLIPLDAVGPEIEIGWRLVRVAWGRGYAPEAAMRIVRHAFDGAGLDRIVADIHAENTRSRRVAEKIGLRLVATEPSADLRYEMTRADFCAQGGANCGR